MGMKQSGDFSGIEQLGARMRAGMTEAGHMVGDALVKRVRDGIVSGAKSGKHYASMPNQSSAPGEYSANQTGDLLNSIGYRMSGHNYLTFYATSDHAGFQEYGTSKMGARPNLKNGHRRVRGSDPQHNRAVHLARDWSAVMSNHAESDYKICSECDTVRPEAEFFPSKASRDGLSARCRDCIFSSARRDRVERETRAALAD